MNTEHNDAAYHDVQLDDSAEWDEPSAEEEVRAAALQFVRTISGFRKPSRVNRPAFDAAVDEIVAASRRLLEGVSATSSSMARTTAVPGSIASPGRR